MISLIRSGLCDRYETTLIDTRTEDFDGNSVENTRNVDLLDRDRTRYRELFREAYAVVHGAFVRSPPNGSSEERFRAEFANIEMAYNVYQAAHEAGARRVVVLSSNHAADYYERLILDGLWDSVGPGDRALSDNYYGWAKECYEHLGFVFATGKATGRPLANIQIRIGGPRETDVARCKKGDLVCVRRALAVYMSARDMLQLFVKSIETEDIRDENGVPFQIFYGISDNPHAFWSIANARRIIGYEPQDNSERRFAPLIAEHLEAAAKKDGYGPAE
jgi:nucleoside-diphosphate-sugar epimerase